MWIWAPNRLDELKGRRGLFEVPEKLGKKLVEAGLVQLPSEGANKLRPISDDAPVKKVVKKRKTKEVVEEDIETSEPVVAETTEAAVQESSEPVEQAALNVDSPES